MTPRQQLASLRRDQRAELRLRDRAKLAELRASIEAERHAKHGRMTAIREVCRERRDGITTRAQLLRAELREQVKMARSNAAGRCAADKAASRAELPRLRAELRAEAADQRAIHRAEGRVGRSSTSARTARAESDDEVARNLPAELLPVWARRKHATKATARMTRTEAFLHWVHDNSGAVERLLNEASERDLAHLVAQEKKLAREMGKPGRYRRHVELEDAPF